MEDRIFPSLNNCVNFCSRENCCLDIVLMFLTDWLPCVYLRMKGFSRWLENLVVIANSRAYRMSNGNGTSQGLHNLLHQFLTKHGFERQDLFHHSILWFLFLFCVVFHVHSYLLESSCRRYLSVSMGSCNMKAIEQIMSTVLEYLTNNCN